MQLQAQIHHPTTVHRFDSHGFLQVDLQQQKPVIILPFDIFGHIPLYLFAKILIFSYICTQNRKKFMRKLIIVTILGCITLQATAQDVWKEIDQDPRRSASNYMAYPEPTKPLTPAPKGKKPFYISHYGRHGSRFIINQRDYDYPYFTLLMADSLGKLNEKGQEILRRMKLLREDANNRLGELTPLGAQQHRDIARRMYTRFPEVFKGDVCIDAKSTVVIRCILSMENALQELVKLNPRLRITHDASEHDMYYMNLRDRKLSSKRLPKVSQDIYDAFCKRHIDPKRPVESLFNDTTYSNNCINLERLNYYIFKVVAIAQNTEMRDLIDFYDLYNTDELYVNWRKDNVYWYLTYGPSPQNGGTQPFSQRNLLRKMIQEADSCISLPRPGATLRFGHETMVLPLTCLLGLNGYDIQVEDVEQLEDKGWVNYRIFPMGANIQFIFYRKNPKDQDVLFKVLLNEEEATLPIPTDCAPYYHWNDFRQHYLQKLDAYKD